jgi:Animal haem peroxidase
MSKYSPPETSRLAQKCQATKPKYSSYRRILPASYRDGVQKPRAAISGKDLPLPRVISNILFTSGLENVERQSENKIKAASDEGVLNEQLSLSVAQWTQFIEHDLSKSVARSLSMVYFLLIRFNQSCWLTQH